MANTPANMPSGVPIAAPVYEVDNNGNPMGTAATADGIAGASVPAEAGYLLSGSTLNREKDATAYGDGLSAGIEDVAPALYNGATYDRTRGVSGAEEVSVGGPQSLSRLLLLPIQWSKMLQGVWRASWLRRPEPLL